MTALCSKNVKQVRRKKGKDERMTEKAELNDFDDVFWSYWSKRSASSKLCSRRCQWKLRLLLVNRSKGKASKSERRLPRSFARRNSNDFYHDPSKVTGHQMPRFWWFVHLLFVIASVWSGRRRGCMVFVEVLYYEEMFASTIFYRGKSKEAMETYYTTRVFVCLVPLRKTRTAINDCFVSFGQNLYDFKIF